MYNWINRTFFRFRFYLFNRIKKRVTLSEAGHIYARQVTSAEEKKIIGNAANKNRLRQSNTQDLKETVTAQSNLNDVIELIANMHRNREPLVHCAVYFELIADSYDELKLIQTEMMTELVRSKLNVDRLLLRQKEGFLAVIPSGYDGFKEQFERVLPASSVANVVLKIMQTTKPKPRYYVTKATYILGFLKRVLSTSLMDKLLNKI